MDNFNDTSMLRVKIGKREQKKLFKKFKERLGGRINAAKFLKIKEGTYKGYSNAKIRYVPKEVIYKICSLLKRFIPKILDSKTLKEIRQTTIKRTYPILRKKYGKNWQKMIAKRGHKSLEKIYGKDWKKIIAKRGHRTSIKRYGKNFQRIIWQKAMQSMKKRYGKDWVKINVNKAIKKFRYKYGKNWGKILMKNARKAHLKKYGKNWPKILSKKGAIKLKKKYGNNYHIELYKLARFLEKKSLSNSEKLICKLLKKRGINFETHCLKNDREYDIIIPSLDNPKIIIESSSSQPTTHNERIKIYQLMEQKDNFPNSINIAILNKNGKYKNFHPATYKFLLNQKIPVFWNEDLKKTVDMIKDYLDGKNKNLLNYRYSNFNIQKSKIRSANGALGHINKSKTNYYEVKLNNLLKRIKANPLGTYIINTKYGNSVAIDNFEMINGLKIAYEVTNSVKQNALRSLIGKIIYLKKLYKKLKFIVVLAKKRNLSNSLLDKTISKYADSFVLKNQFNEKGLLKARNEILLKKLKS